jgi:hypothetical protein
MQFLINRGNKIFDTTNPLKLSLKCNKVKAQKKKDKQTFQVNKSAQNNSAEKQ